MVEIFFDTVTFDDIERDKKIKTEAESKSKKMIFLPQMDKVGVGRGASEQNVNSCLKRSKRVQMGPKGLLMVKNT